MWVKALYVLAVCVIRPFGAFVLQFNVANCSGLTSVYWWIK